MSERAPILQSLRSLFLDLTRLARQVEEEGLDTVFAAADSATALMEEAQPLVATAAELVSELTPLLAELRGGGLVRD